eukprot:Tbor_TRINITY_DN3630_c0_g1::TRINITY_DN3630_c0_g1_i2::g.249::m.249
MDNQQIWANYRNEAGGANRGPIPRQLYIVRSLKEIVMPPCTPHSSHTAPTPMPPPATKGIVLRSLPGLRGSLVNSSLVSNAAVLVGLLRIALSSGDAFGDSGSYFLSPSSGTSSTFHIMSLLTPSPFQLMWYRPLGLSPFVDALSSFSTFRSVNSSVTTSLVSTISSLILLHHLIYRPIERSLGSSKLCGILATSHIVSILCVVLVILMENAAAGNNGDVVTVTSFTRTLHAYSWCVPLVVSLVYGMQRPRVIAAQRHRHMEEVLYDTASDTVNHSTRPSLLHGNTIRNIICVGGILYFATVGQQVSSPRSMLRAVPFLVCGVFVGLRLARSQPRRTGTGSSGIINNTVVLLSSVVSPLLRTLGGAGVFSAPRPVQSPKNSTEGSEGASSLNAPVRECPSPSAAPIRRRVVAAVEDLGYSASGAPLTDREEMIYQARLQGLVMFPANGGPDNGVFDRHDAERGVWGDGDANQRHRGQYGTGEGRINDVHGRIANGTRYATAGLTPQQREAVEAVLQLGLPGVDREVAEQSLGACGWSVEMAAAMLLE